MQLKRLTIAIAACTALGVAGTSAATAFAASSQSLTKPRGKEVSRSDDGRALFSDLFLQRGKFATKLPSSASEETRKIDAKDAAKLLNSIARNDPNFFIDFSKKARSGNPRLVRQALNQAHDQLGAIRTQTAEETGTGTGRCAVLALYAAVVKWQVFWTSPLSRADDALAQDQAVADLTERLASA
ncbi:hypothetical protein [Streptomyces noursei]|uniref:hypothetical protein n=1 Tax=Streptomyces noursei TaxID=1971 RepID=UPI0022A66251|nr:hypothetical protein [Streptomyces noursei]MCZ1014857.1 hypothetical protein [Streptomyces noursei]